MRLFNIKRLPLAIQRFVQLNERCRWINTVIPEFAQPSFRFIDIYEVHYQSKVLYSYGFSLNDQH